MASIKKCFSCVSVSLRLLMFKQVTEQLGKMYLNMHKKPCKKIYHPTTLKPTLTGVIFKVDGDICSQSMITCVCRPGSPSIVLPQAFLASRLTNSFFSCVGVEGKEKPIRTLSRAGPLWAQPVWSMSLPCFWPGYLFPGSLCSSPPERTAFWGRASFRGL